MRPLVLAFVFVCATASAALAAPTCQDVSGHTAKCATPGAMPVGWEPAPEVIAARAEESDGPTPTQLFSLICVVGGLIALIALLPDFQEGAKDGWDREDDDA